MPDEKTILPIAKILGSGATADGEKLGIEVIDDQGRQCVVLAPVNMASDLHRHIKAAEQTAIERLRQIRVEAPEQKREPQASVEITSFTFDLTRVKSPVMSAPLPETFFPFLGQVLVLWSSVEAYFNITFEALREATDTRDEIERGFKKRVLKFKSLSKKLFATCPAVTAELEKIADDALAVAIDRHLLAHGNLHCICRDYAALGIEGKVYGTTYNKEFSLYETEQLFYEMSILWKIIFHQCYFPNYRRIPQPASFK